MLINSIEAGSTTERPLSYDYIGKVNRKEYNDCGFGVTLS